MLDDTIRKAVIGEFIRIAQIARVYPGQPAISIIYGGTPEGDPARKLLVGMYARTARREWISTTCDPVFLLDLAKELLDKAEQGVLPKSYRQKNLVASEYWT